MNDAIAASLIRSGTFLLLLIQHTRSAFCLPFDCAQDERQHGTYPFWFFVFVFAERKNEEQQQKNEP